MSEGDFPVSSGSGVEGGMRAGCPDEVSSLHGSLERLRVRRAAHTLRVRGSGREYRVAIEVDVEVDPERRWFAHEQRASAEALGCMVLAEVVDFLRTRVRAAALMTRLEAEVVPAVRARLDARLRAYGRRSVRVALAVEVQGPQRP